jgi:hypothetical protein
VANLRPFCRHLSLFSRVLGPVFVSSILRDAEGHRVSTPGYSKFTGRILAGKWGGYCILTGKKTVFISSGGDYDSKSWYCKGRFKNHDFRRSHRLPG